MNKTNEINKKVFVELMAEQNQLSKSEADKCLKAVLSTFQDLLSKGDKINLTGFGSFYVLELDAREGRNPATGRLMQIKASRSVRFKAGAKLKEAVNK